MKTESYLFRGSKTTVCHLSSITNEDEKMMLDTLGVTRRDYALSFKERGNHSGYLERLATGYLLESCIDIKDPVYGKTENGRPYIIGTDFDFSLSHSGNYAVCTISGHMSPNTDTSQKCCVGVDIEDLSLMRNPANIERISNRYFTAPEKEMIRDQLQSVDTFITIWTKKEAAAKAADIPVIHMLGRDMSSYSFEVFKTEDYILTVCIK